MLKLKRFQLIIFFIAAAAIPVFLSALPMNPSQFSPEWVFSITNSMGNSRVVYGISLDGSGNISSSAPVYNYWYRPSGTNPRKVTYFENEKMYGISSQTKLSSSSVEIILKTYSEMPILIKKDANKVRAYVTFEGKTYQLKSVSVYAEKAVLGVKVKSVYLILDDSGKEIRRKIR